MSKDTVGKLSTQLLPHQVDDSHSAHDQMLEQLSDYEKNFFECVQTHKNLYRRDFYITVLTKRERILKNILRNYFFGRLSCPTPEYDQSVYKYDYLHDKITYLWTVPDKSTCYSMYNNALEVPKEEHELLGYVIKFMNGTLLKEAKILNGEQPDSPLLIES